MSDAADDREPIDPPTKVEDEAAEAIEAVTPKRKARRTRASLATGQPAGRIAADAEIPDPIAPERPEAASPAAEPAEAADPPAAETAEPPSAPPPTKRPIWKRRPWQIGAVATVAVVIAIIASLLWSLPLGRALEPLANPTLVIVAADGSPIARRGSYKEAPVDVAKLPAYVPGAFIAIEDRRFYKHVGVDPKAILRAVGANAKAGGVSEGGSTITQQLAKNAFLSNKRTFRRKIQEVLIALYLDARLSKD